MNIKEQALLAVSSRKNLIMIDHDALPLKKLFHKEIGSKEQIVHWIAEIVSEKNNIVVLLSDRNRSCVENIFGSSLME